MQMRVCFFFGRCGGAKKSERLTIQKFQTNNTKKAKKKDSTSQISISGVVYACASMCICVCQCIWVCGKERSVERDLCLSWTILIASLSLSLSLSWSLVLSLSLSPLSPLSLSLFRTVGRFDKIRAHTCFPLQCCSALQCVTVCCSVVQCVAVCYSVL